MELQAGMLAHLIVPFKGYRAVTLIEKSHYRWIVEICGSGYRLEVYEDEFELDDYHKRK